MFRLQEEHKTSNSAHFLTLTYNEESAPRNSLGLTTLNKKDVQDFTKRLRKVNSTYTSDQVRYYTVGEYGDVTSRAHYHSIMFNLHRNTVDKLEEVWGNGQILVGTVTPDSIGYVTKYVINRFNQEEEVCPVMQKLNFRQAPFALMSRRPAIGSGYLTTAMVNYHRGYAADSDRTGRFFHHNTQVDLNGVTTRMPRYYKEKIFTEPERARMAADLNNVIRDAEFEKVIQASKIADDPLRYLNYARSHKHELIKKRNNKNNTF